MYYILMLLVIALATKTTIPDVIGCDTCGRVIYNRACGTCIA